ncbi:MAG: quinone-dependent dihydroorotate dehydrogenase [Salinivirgaceae bacterium]|nr:quinone-dependent dihydroorotate dehydrogenase [Salinivirgaceae bacterium]
MYKLFIRPILFKMLPETAHKVVFRALKCGQTFGLKPVFKWAFHPSSLHMKTEVFGLKFPNKVGVAAGLDKNAEVYSMLGSLGFGHIEIGTVTPKPQSGNAKPRSFRLINDDALINRMGFNNKGLESAIIKLRKRNKNLIIGGNIGKNTLTKNEDALSDYLACFTGLYNVVDYIVVNVSCPNVTDLHKLQDQESLELILKTLNDKRTEFSPYKPILLKISPDLNVHQINETLDVIKRCNIDGVIATNTTTSRDDLTTESSIVEGIGNGGLSGKPIKDRSTDIIKYISEKTSGKLPIIGVGGIFTAQDALDKINAGATLVQVYTGFIYEGPAIARNINKEIAKLQK